jgi:hypothetical protein
MLAVTIRSNFGIVPKVLARRGKSEGFRGSNYNKRIACLLFARTSALLPNKRDVGLCVHVRLVTCLLCGK